jgi:transglutaminase-like putative cysteine protease
MHLDAGCRITFDVLEPTPLVLMLRPQSGATQWISELRWTLTPLVPLLEYVDSFGNLCQRVVAPTGEFVIDTGVGVEAADEIDSAPGAPFAPVETLPDVVLQYLLPSRYCQSDVLIGRAGEIVGSAAPGYDQVEAIRHWIHENLEYRYGVSDASTSALDTLERGAGVCRDFTHLGMSLCRGLNIPARMVVGYLHQLEPMDMHAWFEAFVGDRWYTFDATQAEARGGRIIIAYGRDAADVALVTQFGPAEMTGMEVWVRAAESG